MGKILTLTQKKSIFYSKFNQDHSNLTPGATKIKKKGFLRTKFIKL